MARTRCTCCVVVAWTLGLMLQLSTNVCAQPRPQDMEPDSSHTPLSPAPPDPPSPGPLHHPPSPPPHNTLGHLHGSDKEYKKILSMTLPMIVVVTLFGLAVWGVWYMLKRAKRGAFCCLKPSYRLQLDESYKDDDENGILSETPPPDYTLTAIAPPVYQDALQDVIVSTATVGVGYLHSTSAIPPPDYQQEAAAILPNPSYQQAAVGSPPCYQQATASPIPSAQTTQKGPVCKRQRSTADELMEPLIA